MVANLSASDINAHSEQLLIDGTLYAFQEQTKADANVMLNGFGDVMIYLSILSWSLVLCMTSMY